MKKKKKLTKAQQEAQANWERLNAKWDKLPKFSSSRVVPKPTGFTYSFSSPRETEFHPSLQTPGGDTSKIESMSYTGDKVLGIAQMAKSNAVPVFAKQEAVDIARMRRN